MVVEDGLVELVKEGFVEVVKEWKNHERMSNTEGFRLGSPQSLLTIWD